MADRVKRGDEAAAKLNTILKDRVKTQFNEAIKEGERVLSAFGDKEASFRADMRPSLAIVELEKGLRIDEHALEEAWLQQPDLFYRVARELALAVSRRDAATQALKELEAHVDAKARHDAEVAGDKLTETAVKNLVRLDRGVGQIQNDILKLSQLVGEWEALKGAYQQRSYALKDLVALYISRYYGDSERNLTPLRNTTAEHAREQMNQQRRRRQNDE